MSIKWRDEPLLSQGVQVDFLGYDARRLPDGRILMFEWVDDEQPGAVQVHDDQGRDYIVEGDPTIAMLYDSAEKLVELEQDLLLDRLKSHLRGA